LTKRTAVAESSVKRVRRCIVDEVGSRR
jgi:hypothetical protein